MARANRWNNPDGLFVGFGAHDEDGDVMAELPGDGAWKTAVGIWNLADLEDTDVITIASFDPRALVFKRGTLVRSVILRTLTICTTGSTSLLDIGTYDVDSSSVTVDDADGFDADINCTLMNAVGETVDCNGANVDGIILLGATSNSDVQIILGFETAAFTAGRVEITVEYLPPQGAVRLVV